MQKLLFLSHLLATACLAAFTYTGSPNAVNIYHYGAKVIMSTSVPTTANVIWSVNGTTTSCPITYQFTDADSRGNVTDHVYVITSGVPANTVVHWQWCANDGSGVVGSDDQTFTTLPLPNPHPAVATLPQVTVQSTIPAQTGGNTYTYGTSCFTLTTCLAMLTYGHCPTCGDTLLIPHGTTVQDYCAGSNTGGNAGIVLCSVADTWAPGKGWITIRTDSPDSSLPPSDVRIDPVAYKNVMASVENPIFYHNGYSDTLGAAFCAPGSYFWASTYSTGSPLNQPGFHMNQCQPNAWQNVSGISGTIANKDAATTVILTVPSTSSYTVGDTCYFDPTINPVYGAADGSTAATGNLLGDGGMLIPRVGGTCTIGAIPSGTTVTVTFVNYWEVGAVINAGGYPYTVSGTGGRFRNFHWVQITCNPGVGSCTGLPTGSGPSTPSVVLNSLSNIGTSCSTLGQWGYDTTTGPPAIDWSNTMGPQNAVTSTGSVTRCVDAGWGATGYSPGTGNYKWARWAVNLYPGAPLGGNPAPALNLDPASHIKIGPGLRFSYVNVPADPLFLSAAATSTISVQGGKLFNGPVYVGPGSDSVIFDQIYLDGRGYPNGSGPHAMAYLNGSNLAVTNSYAVSDDLIWVGAQDRRLNATTSYDSYYATTFTTSGVLGMLVDNNYIQGCGIGYHFDDEWAPMMRTQDVTFTRNTMYRDLGCQYGSAQNLANYPEGVFGPSRHHLELKQGERFLISGNTFTNGWRTVNNSGAIALTPREDSTNCCGAPSLVTAASNVLTFQNIPASVRGSGLSAGDWIDCDDIGQVFEVASVYPAGSCGVVGCFTLAGSPTISNGNHWCRSVSYTGGIGNITLSNNTISNVPNAFNTIGWEGGISGALGSAPMVFPAPLQYWTSRNNLFYNIIDDGFHQDPGVGQGNGGGYVFNQIAFYEGDITSQHDTVYNVVGGSGGAAGIFYNYSGLWGGGSVTGMLAQNSEGILLNNDIGSMGATPTTCSPACTANSPVNNIGLGGQSGTAMMTELYTTANGPSVIGNNLYQMPVTPPGTYPNTVKWLSDPSQYKFFDAAHNNFRLRHDSPGVSGARLSSDGLDIGADIGALEVAQGKVGNVRAHDVQATSAVIGFLAPDSYGCTVDWSADSWATYQRVANPGGTRVQNVGLSGLPAHTTITYRVNCAVMQPTGNFQTLP